MSSKQLHVGDVVMAADGKELGTIKEVGDTCFRLAARRKRDFWLARDAVQGRDAGIVVLHLDSDHLSDAVVAIDSHTGPHTHRDVSGGSGAGFMKPLLLLAVAGAVAMRDPHRRNKVLATTREGVAGVKSRLSRRNGDSEENDGNADQRPYGATSAFPPSQPMGREPTPREKAVIKEVTLAFPKRNLQVAPVAVHRTEGGEAETLRFTLDEAASSDLEIARLERSSEPERSLADEVIRDLRTQLPPEPENSD